MIWFINVYVGSVSMNNIQSVYFPDDKCKFNVDNIKCSLHGVGLCLGIQANLIYSKWLRI